MASKSTETLQEELPYYQFYILVVKLTEQVKKLQVIFVGLVQSPTQRNLQFQGEINENLRQFLKKIKCWMEHFEIPEWDKLDYVLPILEDSALRWCRKNVHSFWSYDDFLAAFKNQQTSPVTITHTPFQRTRGVDPTFKAPILGCPIGR